MKNFGINYKISKNNGPKKGKLPSVDIETLEKSIEKVEQELKNKPDAVHVEYLLELYSIAVEYYSAGNDAKYEIYKKKTQEIMKSESLTKLVDEEIFESTKTTQEAQQVENEVVVKENELNNIQQMVNEVKISDESNENVQESKYEELKIKEESNAAESTKPNIEIDEPKNEEIGKIGIVSNPNEEQVKIYGSEDEEEE